MGKKRSWVKLMGAACIVSFIAFLLIGTPAELRAASPAPKTIKLGVVLPLTGNFAAGGKRIIQGYEIALKHINEGGGVYIKAYDKKIPLELVSLDNESDPSKAANRMEKLYSVDKVDAFLGGYAAVLTIPQLAIAEKYRIPIIVTTMSSVAEFTKGYKYTFTPFMSDIDMVLDFFDVLDSIPKSERPAKIAFFEIQEEWGKAMDRYLKEYIPNRGYEIVTHEKYAMNANDFSSLIVKAKSAGADILFTTPSPPQGITIMKQMKEVDWSPKFVFIMRAADDSTWPKNLGKDGDYVCHTGGWDYHLKLPGVKRFSDEYKAAYGNFPEAASGVAYTCLQIMADALQRTGNLDKNKLREAIASTNMMTVMGPMKFKSNGRGEGKYLQIMSQWQSGKDELIWPKDQASGALVYPMPPWKKR